MNYEELEKANELLNEIKEIDYKLRQLENPFNSSTISSLISFIISTNFCLYLSLKYIL